MAHQVRLQTAIRGGRFIIDLRAIRLARMNVEQ